MKSRIIVVAAALATFGCSGATSERTPNSTSPSSATTVMSPDTTTVDSSLTSGTMRLSDIEGRAATGVAVQVSWATADRAFTVDLQPGEPAIVGLEPGERVTLNVSYLVEGARSEPAWDQVVDIPAGGTVDVVIEQPWRRSSPDSEPIVMGWQAAGNSNSYREQLTQAPGLTVTSPQWWSIDEEGRLTGSADAGFVTDAHARGMEVWPYVGNGFDPIRTRRLLSDDTRRGLLVVDLASQAMAAGADGVNVDFESFAFVDRDNFTTFVSELTEAVHSWGGVVSVDITVRTDTFRTVAETLSPIYDRRALAEAADYLVLMAYDEHTTVRPAGPTASAAWVESGLNYLLRYADPHQMLLGIPFYARIWDPTNLAEPQAVGIGQVADLAASNPRSFDPAFDLDRVTLNDGRFLWAEDYDHLANRMMLVRRSGVAGVAAWRLGLDSPQVWPIVAPP